jgi:hypothetical protein
MVILTVVTLVAALADAALPSEPQFDVFPAAGTTLPENGRLLVAAAERVLISHDDGRVEDLVPGEPAVFVVDGAYQSVTPTLTDGEVISLEAVCSTCGGMEPLTWAVGPADNDAPAFEEPSFVDVSVSRNAPLSPRYGFAVALGVPLDGPAVVELAGEGVRFSQLADGETTLSFYVQGGEEREACFTVTATDIAGNVGEPQDVCIDLVDDSPGPFGCSQASASSSAVFAVAALLLRRRRFMKGA